MVVKERNQGLGAVLFAIDVRLELREERELSGGSGGILGTSWPRCFSRCSFAFPANPGPGFQQAQGEAHRRRARVSLPLSSKFPSAVTKAAYLRLIAPVISCRSLAHSASLLFLCRRRKRASMQQPPAQHQHPPRC